MVFAVPLQKQQERINIFILSIDPFSNLQYNGSCNDVKQYKKGVYFMKAIVFRHLTNIINKVIKV